MSITTTRPLSETAASHAAVPELDERSLVRWIETIRPAPAELDWQAIPWRPSYGAAVAEAQQTENPILLWAMNGHPLACT